MRLGYACTNMTLTNRPKKLGGRILTIKPEIILEDGKQQVRTVAQTRKIL